jgi:hypothetical protein
MGADFSSSRLTFADVDVPYSPAWFDLVERGWYLREEKRDKRTESYRR